MQRVLTGELASHIGERVLLAGWLHHQRRLSRVTFALLRDRAGLAQLVLDEPLDLLPETVLEVEGDVVSNEQAPGGVEVVGAAIHVLAEPAEAPPIELRRPELKESLPTRLDYAPVAWRHPRERDKLRVAAASVRGFRAALDGLGFTEIQTPKLVASATESGANVFRLDYFGREAFLAQSPQFYKQTMVGVFERVYEVGPVFRAEPHETARHLAEYVSLDAELGFIGDHFDVMAVVGDAVTGMCAAVREAGFDAPEVPREIPWIHFAETGVDDVDLAPTDERRLCEELGEFVFVTGYPMAKRPFYTHPEPSRPEYSNSFDLLFRGLEIVTGGQRLHRYTDYVSALNGNIEPYESYLQAFG
jgi:nondiscriminating aspartyl-tRNA synthetase